MSDKKHIDRLFQEKLKDFEARPGDSVWENITTELEFNKKQNKVVPLWLKITGIAASLLLLFSLGNKIFNLSEPIIEDNVVNTLPDTESIDNENATVKNSIELDTNESENIANEETSTKRPLELNRKLNLTTLGKPDNNVTISKTSNSIDNTTLKMASKVLKETFAKQEETIAQTDLNTDFVINNLVKTKVSNESNDDSIIRELSPQNTSEGRVITDNDSKEISNSKTLVTDNEVEEKLSLTNVLAATNEDESIKNEKDKIDRWSVSPNIAPVYYNTLGKGSHIDEQFVNSTKTGEYNTSYGINIAYAINEKLSVRSGVHNVNLSYDTNNVILFEDLSNNSFTNLLRNTNHLKNITLSDNTQNIAALNGSDLIVQESMGLFPNENAAISQRIGYYEIPVELQYGIVNKDFGVNLIGGFSTFLLNNNEVFSEFQERRNYIGKANNINNISFSANFGVGLDYKFSDNFKFNFEPTFKYQINAFNETSGNFKPYIIGVYTGFSFKF